MNRVAPRSSVAVSEASVTGPYRPSNDTARVRQPWTNSDYPLAPRLVKFTPPQNPRVIATAPQTEQPQQKISLARRVVALTGVFLASVGTVAGMLSIVGLGPIGLAVAVGAFVVGCVLVKVSTQQ